MKIQYLLFAALLLVTACEHPEKVAIENQIENTYFKLTNGTLADADNSPLYNTNLGTTLAMALGPINGILGGDISFEAQNIEVLELEEKTAEVTPAKRPGDFAQAMMDLGSGICTPKKPKH